MHCSQCGTENKPGRKFCANCGQVLSLACSECGFENDAGDKFCGGCGISLGDTNGTRLPNPEVSEPAADSVPDGELRQITVMFCDLADSTAMSNRMDPEQLAHLQGQYRGICDQAIDQFGGYVAKYMGDGILAYYGYPVAHEDDAEDGHDHGEETERLRRQSTLRTEVLPELAHTAIREAKSSGLTPADLAVALRQENVNQPGGTLRDFNAIYLVRTMHEFEDLEQIRRTVVRETPSGRVRVEDVARVFRAIPSK